MEISDFMLKQQKELYINQRDECERECFILFDRILKQVEIPVSLLCNLFIYVTWSEHCDMPFKLSLIGRKPQILSVSDSAMPKHTVSSL